jgi:phenylpropionate dioxygenase-like ring-hydroxylating dioxygenase large terminal subunit
VVFKRSIGLFRVFEDACPHRRVRLSQLGCQENNELVCSYHGWRFDGDNGACLATPGQTAQPEKFCLKSYPVKEYGDWLWVFLGEPQLAQQVVLPRIKAIENSHDYLTISLERTAHCHFSYLVENALDLFHAELHRNPPPKYDIPIFKVETAQAFFSYLVENVFALLPAELQGSFQPWSEAKLIHYQRDERAVEAIYQVTLPPLLTFLGGSQGKLQTRLVYEYPYFYQESEDGNIAIFSVFVPVGQQKTRIYSTFSCRHHWDVPGLTEILHLNLQRGFGQIMAQDIQAVEEEQRAYNRLGRDCSREPNPVAQSARWLILQQDTEGAENKPATEI